MDSFRQHGDSKTSKITPFKHQRWPCTKQPSWNCSTNIFFQTIYSLDQKLDGRLLVVWRLRNILKVGNGAKIRNRYNQVPHLTQDTNGKVTNSQKTPQTRAKRPAPPSRRPQSTHKQTRTKHSKHKTEQKHKRSTKEAPPWNGQQNIPLEGPNRPNGANPIPNPDVDQDTQTLGPYERPPTHQSIISQNTQIKI